MFSRFSVSFQQKRILLFPPVSLADGRETHGSMWLQHSFSPYMGSWTNAGPAGPVATAAAAASNYHTCSLTGVAGCKNLTNVHQLFDARLHLFTRPIRDNRLVRGLVGFGVSDPPPAISRPRILCLSRHRISLRCASISRNNHRW